jgi:hypothetical protein
MTVVLSAWLSTSKYFNNWPFEAEARLNNKESSPYLKENTTTKINWLTLFKEIIYIYSKNYTKL